MCIKILTSYTCNHSLFTEFDACPAYNYGSQECFPGGSRTRRQSKGSLCARCLETARRKGNAGKAGSGSEGETGFGLQGYNGMSDVGEAREDGYERGGVIDTKSGVVDSRGRSLVGWFLDGREKGRSTVGWTVRFHHA
jgi:hypothetical protein